MMFERFTDRARGVVILAEEEARMLNHNWIGTEHLLLGLIREGDGVATQVLVYLGADLNQVRRQTIQLLHRYQAKEPVSDLAERVQQLTDEVERLHALLREHGIDPHDKTA